MSPGIEEFLMEDVGTEDITTNSIVPSGHRSNAKIIAKAAGVLAGQRFAREAFSFLDQEITYTELKKDGDALYPGETISTITGRTRAILTGERVALNILQRLSGTASLTRTFVEAVAGTKARILDTRKTTPGMRAMEKYAVVMGGGLNHRRDLTEMALIKENHIAVAGSIGEAVLLVRRASLVPIEVEVRSMELGSLNLPGFAREAVGDYVAQLLESIEEVNALLAEAEVDVQAITIGGDRLVITGVQRGGPEITATSLLTDLAAAAAAAGPSDDPPAEVLGPGTVNGTFTEGAVYYLALGDSLAANVGAPAPQDGYVSRVHRQLEQRDGRAYGLLNLGVPGETSGSLLEGGQLDEALAFLAENRVAYITLDVGANDLLGHLTSPECSADLGAAGCRERLDGALDAYEENLPELFAALRRAAPQATIIFLKAYNPFSLGTGIAFETETGFTLDRLNDLAEAAAGPAGILVADGFSPMEGMAAYTTLMLASPPDIHPNALGHDVLAQAVLAALD